MTENSICVGFHGNYEYHTFNTKIHTDTVTCRDPWGG